MSKKLIFLTASIIFLLSAKTVLADDRVVSPSASFKRDSYETRIDHRVIKLREFLVNRKSPLAEYAFEFVYYADLYNIDWRLVPAISGVESGFGKKMPKNSYNAYGWVNGLHRFSSWDNSIEVVSKTLREKYYDRGATNISKISRRYAPPSNSWGWKVKFFMEKIDPIPVEFDL